MRDRTIERWVPILIALAAFLAFLPALNGSFLGWDGESMFANNLAFRGFAWRNLRWMFTTLHTGPYQPLSWLTYAVDYKVWGLEPFGYHLTNLALHAANAALFFLVSSRLLAAATTDEDRGSPGRAATAALAALLFALHPLRVESVAWVTERRDVLSGFFYLLALLLYLCGHLKSALAAFALSLLGKASGLTLPAVLLILDAYPLRRLSPAPRQWLETRYRPVLTEKVPFLLLALVAAIVGIIGQGPMIRDSGDFGLVGRLVIPLYSYWFYAEKTLLPSGLSPLYQMPVPFDPLAPRLLLGAAAAAVSAAALIAMRRRFPSALVAGLCYAVTLLPMAGLVPFGHHLTADRYSYLACLPWALLAAAAWRAAAARSGRGGASVAVASVVLLMLGILTWRQSGVWRSDETLWRHALRVDPANRMAHNNMGVAATRQGLHEQALTHFSVAASLDPGSKKPHINRCGRLAHLQRWEEAVAACGRALALDAHDAEAHANMGVVRAGQGRFTQTDVHFAEALELDPGNRYAPTMVRWLKERGKKLPSIR